MTDDEHSPSNLHIKQTLNNWARIELVDEETDTLEVLVWGEPTNRPPGRFKLTSPVSDIVEEAGGNSSLVYTKNSLYRVLGRGLHFTFPLSALEMLSSGYSPDKVTKFYRVPG